jgi:hypothetical protein
MKTLLLLPLLLMLFPASQNPPASTDGSQVAVLDFKWTKSRLTIEQANSANVAPAAAMIPANRNFERNRRINDPAGVRDPNADTLDGRSAALEKSVEQSRTPKPLDGFAYRAKVQNASAKVIEILFWEYQFKDAANPAIMSRRQFLCGVVVKPGKEKDVQGFSLSGPTDVISVGSLGDKSKNLYQENVVINRVEYADGSIWQRKDWNFGEVRLSYARAVATPWGSEMCRGL